MCTNSARFILVEIFLPENNLNVKFHWKHTTFFFINKNKTERKGIFCCWKNYNKEIWNTIKSFVYFILFSFKWNYQIDIILSCFWTKKTTFYLLLSYFLSCYSSYATEGSAENIPSMEQMLSFHICSYIITLSAICAHSDWTKKNMFLNLNAS